jgi:hypothetical protein
VLLLNLLKNWVPSTAASRSIKCNAISPPSTSEAHGWSSLNSFILLCQASVFLQIQIVPPCELKCFGKIDVFFMSVRGLCSKCSNFYYSGCARD